MENFIIDSQVTGKYYIIFNTLTYIVGLVLLFIYGKKNKFPSLPWLLTITSAFIFFVAGCKLLAMDSNDWQFFSQHFFLPRDPGRSLLGGLGLGLLGILIGKWYFKLPWKSIDAFAWALPVGIAIHRMGCFAAGCCFGTSTEVPWAVHYGSNTPAFRHSVQNFGAQDLLHTHALHPVQLYESLLCLLIIVALIPISKKLKKAGSLLGISVALYCVARFGIAFFRFHSSDWQLFGEFNLIQVILFIVTLIILSTVYIIESTHHNIKIYTPNISLGKSVYFLFWSSLIFLCASLILKPFEIMTIQLALFPCLIISLYKAYQCYTVPHFRLTSVALVVFSFLFMGQTVPEQQEGEQTEEDKENLVRRYHSIYTGILSGNTDIIDQSTTCEGDPVQGTRTDYKNQYYNYGAGYEHSIEYNDPDDILHSLHFGLSGFGGRHLDRATGLYNMQRILTVYGFSPYIRLETKRIGLAFGGTIGNFAKIDAFADERATTVSRYWLYPMASIRYGRVDKFYMETRIGDFFPSAFPGFTTQFAIGFMDKNKRNGLRIGTASNAAFFINPTLALGESWSVAPMLGFGGPLIHDFYEQNNFQASFRLQYKFEVKKTRETN